MQVDMCLKFELVPQSLVRNSRSKFVGDVVILLSDLWGMEEHHSANVTYAEQIILQRSHSLYKITAIIRFVQLRWLSNMPLIYQDCLL